MAILSEGSVVEAWGTTIPADAMAEGVVGTCVGGMKGGGEVGVVVTSMSEVPKMGSTGDIGSISCLQSSNLTYTQQILYIIIP